MTELETTKEKKPPMVTLHVQDNRPQDPTVAVAWCLHPKLPELLRQNRVLEPHLLIQVIERYPNGNIGCEIDRHVVPLNRALHFIQFRKPGSFLLRAIVFWSVSDGGVHKDLANILEKNTWHEPLRHYLGSDPEKLGSNLRQISGNIYCIRSFEYSPGDIELQIGEEYFAKEPPKWLKRWVNLWYETDPVDQCSFRRRMMLAFSIQPIVMLVAIVFLFAFKFLWILLLFLFGNWRSMNPLGIFWPIYFGGSPSDAVSTCVRDGWPYDTGICIDANPFITKKVSKGVYEKRNGFGKLLIAFIPFLFLMETGFLWIVWKMMELAYGYRTPIGIGVGSVAVVLLLVFLGDMLWSKLFNSKPESAEDREAREVKVKQESLERKRKEREGKLDAVSVQLKALACKKTPPPLSVAELPPERVTISLRWQDLKRRVCRPFAR